MFGTSGVTIDAQCEYILDSYKPGQLSFGISLTGIKVIQKETAHIFFHTVDPKDKWGKLTRDFG